MAWDGGKAWLKRPGTPRWVKSQQKWQPKHQPGWRPKELPAGFEVDSAARHAGTVAEFYKWRGYGFVRPAEEGLVPGGRLYVHWSNIQTDDRFPALLRGMDIEFGIMKWKDKRQGSVTTLRAKYVTLPGGASVAVQDEEDSKNKTFVGGQHLRYTGTVKFYSPKGGYGYVLVDEGYSFEEPPPRELRVEEAEVNAGGKKVNRWLENISVEFGIWKTSKGAYKAYNMTLPGGAPITEERLENRQTVGQETYRGQVTYWNWRQNFGLIKAGAWVALPQEVESRLARMQEAAKQSGKKVYPEKLLFFRKADVAKGCSPKEGLQVSFRVYVDDKGAGACVVQES